MITDRIITAQEVIDAGASYEDDDEVRRLIPEPIPMSTLIDLDIPEIDKVRGVLTMIGDRRERVGAAAAMVRPALQYTDDQRVHACLDVCDRYARGEATDQELSEAASAASATADEAAASVARATRAAAAARAEQVEILRSLFE